MTDIMSALHETYLYGGGCQMDDEHLAELLNQIDELKQENEDLKEQIEHLQKQLDYEK
ncbi:hypothetical protein [Holdemania filiformis]|uniref:hypothetical protein n=1 Tax=Holdemania filiformis TaxID=61171 RepID=UPI00242F28EA|nr:hypothetical protein [Holdemania filiformis]